MKLNRRAIHDRIPARLLFSMIEPFLTQGRLDHFSFLVEHLAQVRNNCQQFFFGIAIFKESAMPSEHVRPDLYGSTWVGRSTASGWTGTKSLRETIMELQKLLPPLATREQLEWAKLAGFPGYPGFIIASDVYDELVKSLAKPTATFDMLFGVPVRVNQAMPKGTIRSAEAEWEYLKKLHDEMFGMKMELRKMT